MIKSTKVSLKFSNINKLDSLYKFINEYKRIVSIFIDELWRLEKVPVFLPQKITSNINTWLSARMVQCAGKQASGIVRGTKKKQEQRLWQINKFVETRMFKKARKLQIIYNKINVSKPNILEVEPELDSRFIKIDLYNRTSFDGWVTMISIGNKLKLKVPFKKTKHFNKMLLNGKLKTGIRLSKNKITFMFDLPEPIIKENGNILGIDIGKINTISCSNGFVSTKNKHGYDLNSILNILSRKKKGSKAFERTVQHRTNYINWSINQLNLVDIKQVNLENIKNLRKYKRNSRMLSHWTYPDIFEKLENYCKEQGVLVKKISPIYTSQRCSKCGWTRKGNRKMKWFKCDKCFFEHDADLNASINLSLDLPPIGGKERLLHKNKIGFYWSEVRQEPIVPVVQKAIFQ